MAQLENLPLRHLHWGQVFMLLQHNLQTLCPFAHITSGLLELLLNCSKQISQQREDIFSVCPNSGLFISECRDSELLCLLRSKGTGGDWWEFLCAAPALPVLLRPGRGTNWFSVWQYLHHHTRPRRHNCGRDFNRLVLIIRINHNWIKVGLMCEVRKCYWFPHFHVLSLCRWEIWMTHGSLRSAIISYNNIVTMV